MQDAQEFVPNYIPMKADPVSMSNAKSVKMSNTALRATRLSAVRNTIDLTDVVGQCWSGSEGNSSVISGSRKYLGTNGHYSFISSSQNIKFITFDIPKSSLPTSGSYLFSYSYSADVANVIRDVRVYVAKTTANAAGGIQHLTDVDPNIIDGAGQFKRDPVLVDFRTVSRMTIQVQLVDGEDATGGILQMRFEVSSSSGGEELGFPTTDSQNTQEIANNTSELVYSQNETNGLLEDIIQHISDQLAAMWDQIYNLMAVPWIQNDNQRTNNTINAIEDSSESTNTTIEQQSSWHANFIIDGLKSLFIPDEDYFSDTITDLFDWFEDKFGFLGYTLTYFIRLLNGIVGASQNTVIRFPGINVPNRATNETYQILPAQNVDLAAQISLISEDDFNLLEFMRTAGDIVLVLGFIVMLQNKLHEVESK